MLSRRPTSRLNRGRVGSSTPRSTPASIFGSALKLWLRADMGALNASGTAAANGEAVETWTAQAGYSATNGTAAARPLYVASWKNGKPALDFDGTDDELLGTGAALIADGGAYTLYVVGAKDNDPDAANYNDQIFRIGLVSAVFHKHVIQLVGGTRYIAGDALVDISPGSAFGCGTNPFYAAWLEPGSANADTVGFRINGSARTASGGQLRDLSSSTGYRVGGVSTAYLNGKVGEVILVSGVATPAQITAVEGYLTRFWGAF
jgi:hypothetical protein